MKKLLVFGFSLICAAHMLSCAAGEEAAEGRYRLYISARDPGGGKLFFAWRQLPNEAPRVKIADPNAGRLENGKWISETYFIATEPGKYQFEVSVKNEAGEESKKTFQQEVLPPTPPPLAVAGKDQEIAKPGDPVVLDGSASTAAAGRNIAGWDWRVLKAPGDFQPDVNLLKQRSFAFKPADPGVYQFELKVFDGRKWSEPARTTVTVLPPAPPPVAAAGRDRRALAGDTVRIDGSESKAAEGLAITAWEWRVVQAPAPFALDANLLKQKTFELKLETPGVYLLELRVSDGRHWGEPSRTTVTVAPAAPPPVAAAGKDQTAQAGDTVKLDGSASKAADDSAIAEWKWKVIQAPPGFNVDEKLLKERAFEFKPEAAGVYRFELLVFDGRKWSEPSRTAVAVAPPIPPPMAVAGKDQTRTVGEVVRLNGVDSKANGELPIAEWEWRVVEAPPKFKLDAKLFKERSFDFKAQEAGVYKFELRVSDSRHWSEWAPVAVTITPGQPPKIDSPEPAAPVELPPKPTVVEHKVPEIKAVVAPGGTAKAGETIVLDGSKSVVDESLKPEFFWRQDPGQGPLARQLAPDKRKPFSQARLADPLNYPVWTCKPEEPGEYKFIFEITTRTQSGGAEAVTKTESEPVVYKIAGAGQEAPPAPPTPPPAAQEQPVAKINTEHVQVAAGEMVKLDGSKSSGKPGEKLEYVWGPVHGKRYPKSWSGTDGPQVEFKAEEEGEYGVALLVKDSSGRFSEQAQVVVKVGPAGKPPVVKLAKSYECVVGEQVRIESEATDPDGTQLEYKWSCVDPPELVIPDKLARNSILVFVPKNTGAYVFKVTVSNAKGLSEAAQTMVGVKDALTRPPTAIIEGPKRPVGTGAVVRLSAARSSDPAKKQLTYLWKQEDGPGGVKVPGNVPGERDEKWEFTPTEQGRYVFSLVVSNGVSKSDPDKFELTVTKANNPPAASIVGPPGGRLALGEQATLDGSTSSDPDNDKLTFKWRKADVQPKAGAKAGEIELSGADQEKATVKGVAAGPARVELVVNDGTVDSDPTYIDLNIVRPNNPPVAKITGPEASQTGAAVELSAAESSDPDGDEITYVWSQPSDGGPEIGVRGRDLRKKTLRFKPERSGTYVINLQVVDTAGLKSDMVTHKLEVKGINKPPIAVASRVGNEAVSVGSEVKLTARGSHDPEGAQLTYRWKQVGGEALPKFANDAVVDSEVVNVVPQAPGKYSFELVVNDGELDSKPAALSFTAKGANRPPVAVVGDVVPCEPGGRVVLDGSASHDPEGQKLEYRWSQVSGPETKFSTGKARTEVELRKEGEYVFELKVGAGNDWSEPARVTVKTRAGNLPPVAAFLVPEVRTEENVEAVLDASASNDPDNGPQPLSYHWKQLSGPKTELLAEGAKARFTPKKAGNLVFQVKVSDGKADSAPAEVKVEVLKAGSLPVAVAVAKPNPVKAAQKGNKDDPNILELNGEKSRPGVGGTALTYQWKQVSGEDLKLRPSDLAKGRVGLRVFRPGTYRFTLVVSDGQNRSAPAYLDVEVIEGAKGPETGAPGKTEPAAPKTESPAPPPPSPAPEDKTPKTTSEAPAQQPAPKSKEPVGDSPLSPQLQALADLAKKPDREAEKTLIEALSNANAQVRSTAAVALSKRGASAATTTVVPALIGVLETGSAAAKKEAHFALKEITHESFPPDADKWKQWWAKSDKQAADPSAASVTK